MSGQYKLPKGMARRRGDIGEVRIFIEDFMSAREIPSCAHTEAVLESVHKHSWVFGRAKSSTPD
jgi:hypothetical protein